MPNIFEGQLVRLRAVEPSDWEAFYSWGQETEAGRALYEIPFPQSREKVREWTASQAKRDPDKDTYSLVIERLDGEIVGSIDPHTTNPRNGTFMYGLAILPQHRRKGYASEASRLLLRYFFRERRYQKCTVEVFSFNEPSIRLHESLGFKLEGRLRRMIYTDGQFYDALYFGMTREEFEAYDSQVHH